MNFLLLAAEAANAVPAADGGNWWKSTGLVFLGMILMKLASWIASWLDGKGKAWIDERLTKVQEQINSNSVMAQIQLDDALIKLAKDAIPEVIAETSETTVKSLKDGKISGADWEGFGSRLWEKIKPHVEGGKNDYLKDSSFDDGKAFATWIFKKVFAKEKAKKEGTVSE